MSWSGAVLRGFNRDALAVCLDVTAQYSVFTAQYTLNSTLVSVIWGEVSKSYSRKSVR